MILEMKYNCGCVMSRMRESEPFELKQPCAEHGGSLSSAAWGAGPEPTKAPIDLSDMGVEMRTFKPQFRIKTEELSGEHDVAVTRYVWNQLSKLLVYLKGRYEFGSEEFGRIADVQDLLWRCEHGRKAPNMPSGVRMSVQAGIEPVTQRVTPKSNNERDCDWRNVIRIAIKDFDRDHGTTISQSWEAPPSGPAVFAFCDLLTQTITAGRDKAVQNIVAAMTTDIKLAAKGK